MLYATSQWACMFPSHDKTQDAVSRDELITALGLQGEQLGNNEQYMDLRSLEVRFLASEEQKQTVQSVGAE